MWFKKLKKKKVQYLLIALILMFIAAIFSGSLIFVLGINDFTETYYSSDSSPEFYFALTGEDGKKALEEYAKEKNTFKELFFQKGKVYKSKLSIGKKSYSLLQSNFYALEDAGNFPFHFSPNGKLKDLKKPERGTVWIASVFADVNEIHAGDVISIKEEQEHTFTVAGTYNSSINPSTSMGFYPFYIHPDDLDKLNDLTDGYYGCFQRNDRTEELSEFLKVLPAEFTQSIQVQYDLDGLRMSLSMVVMIVAGIGLMSAVVIFCVSLIIIRFILKSTLAKEYKSIGIYKAVGFQSREIIGFYLKGYIFTGVISIVAGSILGVPFGNYLGTFSVKYLNGYKIRPSLYWFVLYSIFLLTAVLILNVFLALRKINKMNPVNALNMGMTSSKTRLKKSLIPNAHAPLSMAVNEIFKRKSNSLMIMLILTAAFYLTLFFSMTGYTCINIPNNSASWFAIPDTRCFVNGVMTEELENAIDNSPYVEEAVYGQFYLLLELKSDNPDVDLTNCSVFSYSDFSQDITHIPYTTGREPEGEHEIAVSKKARAELDASIGDYVRLNINGKDAEYLISGQYDSMVNGGMSMQIPNAALDACDTEYENTLAFVKLKDHSDFKSFKKELEGRFGTVDVTKDLGAVSDASKSITEIVAPVTIALVIIFISFGFLNIVNMLLMNNLDHRKRFGILKALGFTNGYIMRQNLYHILLLSGSSILLSLCIHFGISAKLFQATVGVNGFENDPQLIIALSAGMLFIITITSLAFAVPIRKITPTELMEE